jgi:snRNA-activating protein complex subunit 4
LFSLKFDLREVEEKLKIDSSQDVDKFVPKREDNDTIDWLEISAQIGSSHPPLACEIKWLNELHPDINHEPWSQEEDEKLQDLVEKYNNDWDKIADELATNRIAYQCICRYQSFLNPKMKRKGLFSKAEQDFVNEVIANCRVGSYIPWNQVSYFIEGRSLAQVKHYWEKRNSLTKNRKWTELEDNVLIQAVEKFGLSNWVKVAYFLPGRTNRQCRERYIMRLGVKNRKVAEWSSSEDKKLLELAPAFNYRWATLVNHINGRNPHQIASRYDVLEKISLKRSGQSLDLNDEKGNLLEDSKVIPRRKRKCAQKEEANSIKSRIDISSKDEFLRESRRKLEQMLKRELSRNVKKVDTVNNRAELGKHCGEAQIKKMLYYDNKKKKRVVVKQDAVDQELLQLFGLYSLYRKPNASKGSGKFEKNQCF